MARSGLHAHRPPALLAPGGALRSRREQPKTVPRFSPWAPVQPSTGPGLYPQYVGAYPQHTPSLCGGAQTPIGAGNIRGMGVGAEWAADRSQTEHHDGRRRVTVSEAADILGITAEAVRTRIKRGRLDAVKDPPKPGGTVYVLLPVDLARPNTDPTPQGQDQTSDQTAADALAPLLEAKDETIKDLRDRVRYLEWVLEEEREARTDERRRHDTLMAQLMQRIPELEAPQEPPGGPETADSPKGPLDPRDTPFTSEERTQEATIRPRSSTPWWRRVFGG
jgi:hypothetical protein